MNSTCYPEDHCPHAARILIVDDEEWLALLLGATLAGRVHAEILTATSGSRALEIMQVAPVDLLITDYIMPGMNGLELIALLRRQAIPVRVLLITGFDVAETHTAAQRLGVTRIMIKPFDPREFREAVRVALLPLT